MEAEGHYGCPKCGSPKFSTTQNGTEYFTEVIHCTFTTTDPDELAEYDINDYGDRDTYDSDTTDTSDDKTCDECSHEYRDPAYYPPKDTIDSIAERSKLDPEEVRPFTNVFETLKHAHTISVAQEAHATVITATPHAIRRSTHVLYECCKCGTDLEEDRYRTRHVYREMPGGLSNREMVFDRRQLPVVVRTVLCNNCQ